MRRLWWRSEGRGARDEDEDEDEEAEEDAWGEQDSNGPRKKTANLQTIRGNSRVTAPRPQMLICHRSMY